MMDVEKFYNMPFGSLMRVDYIVSDNGIVEVFVIVVKGGRLYITMTEKGVVQTFVAD